MVTTEERIIRILKADETIYFCAACLALKIGAHLQETKEVVVRLDRLTDFTVTQAKCSECLSVRLVVCAAPVGQEARGLKRPKAVAF